MVAKSKCAVRAKGDRLVRAKVLPVCDKGSHTVSFSVFVYVIL